ncbi:VOC family protein [Paralimibaculum aggregatum]|uniref:VOC family protein n=1 Tax=Paralimibaculum aggregatum TaxID=3036245 RepID=A0ABQ6LPD3_9RHOB|nr:VOC family protein [Limibaculum sp. NKW23]GMG84371.1 VOC family protein [Limibaculum sp. NKW23]
MQLDHLVVCAADLAGGVAWAEARLGTPPGAFGRHAEMGTRNALWGLGNAYLEVIAVDPEGRTPPRPRWFGLDDPAMQARLAGGPVLATWAVALEALDGLAPPAGLALERLPFARDDLTWEVALTTAAALPLGGAWPLAIRWKSGLHPAKRLGDQGLRLRRLEIAGAGAEAAGAAFGPVTGAAPVEFRPGPGATRLAASIATAAGEAEL